MPFTQMEKLGSNIKSEKQARNYLSYLERALLTMQKEMLKNPPEETENFKKNSAIFWKGFFVQWGKWFLSIYESFRGEKPNFS